MGGTTRSLDCLKLSLWWQLQQLRDIDNLSEYSQECSAALLMNLSLRTAGNGHMIQCCVGVDYALIGGI